MTIVLDNVRSLYNVGAFFRTADAAGIEKLYLCGITGRPPKSAITKTALGAEETVAVGALVGARCRWSQGCAAAGTRSRRSKPPSMPWTCSIGRPRFPVCLIFGHEVDGIRPELSALCDTHVRIPMLGTKHSLNVATAGGVVIYELLRKYRELSIR